VIELTLKQVRHEVIEHCERQTDCRQCVIEGHDACECYNHLTAPEEVIRDAYNKIHPPEPVEEEPTSTHDIVNHPEHYCREGAMECIDEMITLFGREVVKHFCLCNAWKYRYRSNQKNGDEDIKKSDWYIRKYKELCQ
jgi:hypothetical protein